MWMMYFVAGDRGLNAGESKLVRQDKCFLNDGLHSIFVARSRFSLFRLHLTNHGYHGHFDPASPLDAP